VNLNILISNASQSVINAKAYFKLVILWPQELALLNDWKKSHLVQNKPIKKKNWLNFENEIF